MKFIFSFLFFLSFSLFLNAQKISGVVKDEQGKTVSSANLALHSVKDSSVVKITATDKSGQYEFAGINPGTYYISSSFIGYAAKKTAAFELQATTDIQVPDLVIEKMNTSLQGVTVVSKRQLVEVKSDKTILNVEGTINATGSDALELLRKSPGVTVDRDDNIILSGKNGVQIFVDGRKTPLSGKDLADYLRSINSNAIDAIELITNPSAKYDAAGNAGIINIRLKKNRTFGTNGSVTAGYNIGTFSKYNGGLALNHRNKNINLFGNYNVNRNLNSSFMKLYRIQLDTLFDQKSDMRTRSTSHNFKGGADYFLDNKNTIGVIVNGTVSEMDFANLSRTPISYIPTGEVNRILVADNSNKMNRENFNFNLNYRYADTAGRELNVDADYGLYNIKSDQFQPNFYLDPNTGNEQYRVVYNMVAPTDLDIYTIKADYEQNFKKGKLGIGGKFAYINSDNTFRRYDVNGSGKILDLSRSNFFEYQENINALYINYNRPFKGFMIQAGLRAENTTTKGDSYGLNNDGSVNTGSKINFSRQYTDFFPSAALTLNKNPMSQWSFTYSRRIDRPAYQDLNPFEFKLDEYTFQKGNTSLRPQYTNSAGISHTYKYKLNTTLNYSHVKDVFTQLIDTAEKSKSFITRKNLATQDIVSLTIGYPIQVKWWTGYANVNSYYSHYVADFGTGRTIDLDVFAYTFFAQNSFNLGKGWTGELSGFYSSPSIWQGTFESKRMWNVDAGFQKTILKGKGNLKATVSDIFQTMRWQGVSNFAGQYLKASGGWESRMLKVNFTWRFGNTQVKAARQRKSGAEEETKRVQGGGGGIGQ